MKQEDIGPHEEAARAFRDNEVLDNWSRAAERGRRMAAEMIRTNPGQRKLVEEVYGIEFCRNRWPEAYHRRG